MSIEQTSVPGWQLIDRSDRPEPFLRQLPQDWHDELKRHWDTLAASTRVLTLEDADACAGGGLLFSEVSPDVQAYREVARDYLDAGYCYIAYLWIAESWRGAGLGSYWLQALFRRFPRQAWWLTIEDHSLESFYLRNGFITDRLLTHEQGADLAMIKPPLHHPDA